MRKMVLLASAVLFTTTANAQDQCPGYVGQVIAPKTFDSAIAGLAKLTPKGEFETTAQYEARKAASVGDVPGAVIISKVPEDRKYFEYNADSQKLRIITYAFQNTGFDIDGAFFDAGLDGKIDARNGDTVVISRTDKATGTYLGSNGFGAKATIARVQRVTKAIFEAQVRQRDILALSIFPAAASSPYVVGELTLSPAEAQVLKPKLKLAFVVQPKEPFLVKGNHSTGKTTIQNPTDITEDFSILIGDIQCGLVTDAANKVLGSYSTR